VKIMGKLLKTKTFWGGVAGIMTGIGLIANGDIPAGANAIVTSIIAIFLRDGIQKAAAG
jgi:hypothetical protein